jgi:hypothetical protein
MAETWRNCGTCKKPIAYNATYLKCSVSSCNRKRFQLVFCTLTCWDAHVPVMNHRNAWAEEERAPPPPSALPRVGESRPTSRPASRPAPTRAPGPAPRAAPLPERTSTLRRGPDGAARRVARPDPFPPADREILIVASRLKTYIATRSGGMSTSADVMEILSDIVRAQADRAITEARKSGRKTVMARDFR